MRFATNQISLNRRIPLNRRHRTGQTLAKSSFNTTVRSNQFPIAFGVIILRHMANSGGVCGIPPYPHVHSQARRLCDARIGVNFVTWQRFDGSVELGAGFGELHRFSCSLIRSPSRLCFENSSSKFEGSEEKSTSPRAKLVLVYFGEAYHC